MGKKTRSARGEIVDFDLLEIKQQIASAPKAVDIKKREDFIDRKLRRRLRNAVDKIDVTTQPLPEDSKDVPPTEPEAEKAPRRVKKKRD